MFDRVTSQTRPMFFFKMAPTGILVFFAVSSMVMTVRSASLITATPPGCVWNGQWYPEGPEFRPDPCTFCNCISGKPSCAVADCAPPSCVDYVRDPNQCCPSCPNGNNCRAPDGTIIPVGKTVHISPTTTCRCQNTGFLMNSEAICLHSAPTTAHAVN